MEERQSRRRQRRVRYEGNVYVRGMQQTRPVLARAQNLSPEGIAVTAEGLPHQGEEVECRLVLGGRRTRLRGRVAWLQEEPGQLRTRPAGGGIQFLSMEGEDRELLSRLVEDASDGPQPVEVWVGGNEHPITMRALIGTEEVKLGVELPRLTVGTSVEIALVHRGVSERRQGMISAVRFLPGDGATHSRVAMQVSTPRPSEGAGVIRADELDVPLSEIFEEAELGGDHEASMVVDLAALTAAAATPPPAGRPLSATPLPAPASVSSPAGDPLEQTLIVPYPDELVASVVSAKAARRFAWGWALATLTGVVGGMAVGALVLQPLMPQLLSRISGRASAVADVAAPNPSISTERAPSGPVTIEPLAPRPAAVAAPSTQAAPVVKRHRRRRLRVRTDDAL